jgi:septal ring factor EnvC (AmiA/AmiB activator)
VALFDSTTIAAIATGTSGVVAALLLRTGRKSGERQEDDEQTAEGVSLTKQLMDQQRADFRARIRDLERETRELRSERNRACAERDQLRFENDFLNARIRELGG